MVLMSSVFVHIVQTQNDINTIGVTVSFLQRFVYNKVNDVVHIVKLIPKDCEGKQVKTANDLSSPIATIIWNNYVRDVCFFQGS